MEIFMLSAAGLISAVVLSKIIQLVWSFTKNKPVIKEENRMSKKYAFADVDKYKTTFGLIGLATTLILILLSVELYAEKERVVQYVPIDDDYSTVLYFDEKDIPKPKEVLPPPMPTPPPPPVAPPLIKETEKEVKPLNVKTEELSDKELPMPPVPSINTDRFKISPPSPPPPPAAKEAEKLNKEILNFASVQPEYPGGVNVLRNEVQKNYKIPSEIKRGGAFRGTIVTRFVVTDNGSVGQVEIVKGIEGCEDCTEQARAAILKLSKTFTPGKQAGKPVNVWFTLPIVIEIR